MTSPRPVLHATASTAVALLLAAVLVGCTSEASQEVVAPIVLTERVDAPGATEVGAEPVQPPAPERAGDDTTRRQRDDAGGGEPGPPDDDPDDDAAGPAGGPEPDDDTDDDPDEDDEDDGDDDD